MMNAFIRLKDKKLAFACHALGQCLDDFESVIKIEGKKSRKHSLFLVLSMNGITGARVGFLGSHSNKKNSSKKKFKEKFKIFTVHFVNVDTLKLLMDIKFE